jgi:hypothetical protein
MRGRSAMSAGTADASSIFGAGMISTGSFVVLKRNMSWNVRKELRGGVPIQLRRCSDYVLL